MSVNLAAQDRSVFQVQEIFYSLQGEGRHAGRAAVFCRFVGCNLWTGREEDRATAKCRFCDTTFIGATGEKGGSYTEEELVKTLCAMHPRGLGHDQTKKGRPLLVFTGGEPALQLTASLLSRLRHSGFELSVETNGTLPLPDGLDWITVSPKAGTKIVVTHGHELKLVWPQPNAAADFTPEQFVNLDFAYFTLQPCDGPCVQQNTMQCLTYCLQHPVWHLGLQLHKIVQIP